MAIGIGLVGTGTVGGGCIDIFNNHKDDFLQHFGVDMELVAVSSRRSNVAEEKGYGDVFFADFHDVIAHPEVDIVIELIGGTTTAREVVCEALKAGKNVVTANKALLATYGEEIMGLAAENGCDIAYEASVGGGIPIIGPLKHSLIANGISSVMGIVNGTTNYMLTRMDEDGASYDDVLKEAQAKGFAEANPTADVDGFDAAAKCAILASIAFNSRVTMEQVHTEGISNLTPADLAAARDLGYVVKLLAIANRTDDGVSVRVHPAMLPADHQMAKVNGVFNAIYVTGDAVGETMFFGEGAGAGPAASAVMGDVVDMARRMANNVPVIHPCTCKDNLPIVPMGELETQYYLHVTVADRSGVLAATAKVFADHNVSVRSMMQLGRPGKREEKVDIFYLTHTAREADVMAAIEDIRGLDNVLADDKIVVIRVQE